jgi:hypothetical protein
MSGGLRGVRAGRYDAGHHDAKEPVFYMPTYAIGDLQGCDRALVALLETLRFDPKADRLLLVGDLVNRGPDSLAVLWRIKSLGDGPCVGWLCLSSCP